MDTLRGHIKRIPELLAPKIDTIKTNFDEWKAPWTQDRAEKLDNLDVPVSSRAPANTALSNSVWTNTRAGRLDLLSSISTNVSSLIANPKVVKSVQRGTASYSSSPVRISSVTPSKCLVVLNGVAWDSGDGGTVYVFSLTSTSITFGGRAGKTVGWEVIEFY